MNDQQAAQNLGDFSKQRLTAVCRALLEELGRGEMVRRCVREELSAPNGKQYTVKLDGRVIWTGSWVQGADMRVLWLEQYEDACPAVVRRKSEGSRA